ncbi:hypothetical protein [Bacteroides heparinolyticus]|uniref:hypothetical protein n=1 Tax=Prevotella heparinolytica TaxID=28113 RepID=UPI00359F2CB9
MNGTEGRILSEERRRKSDEAQQFSEDRAQLLDTIREMIDIELERRGVNPEGNPHPENPPPEDMGCTPPGPPPRRTLWQRIVSFFTGCLP